MRISNLWRFSLSCVLVAALALCPYTAFGRGGPSYPPELRDLEDRPLPTPVPSGSPPPIDRYAFCKDLADRQYGEGSTDPRYQRMIDECMEAVEQVQENHASCFNQSMQVLAKCGASAAGLLLIVLGVPAGPVAWCGTIALEGLALLECRDAVNDLGNCMGYPGNIVDDLAIQTATNCIPGVNQTVQACRYMWMCRDQWVPRVAPAVTKFCLKWAPRCLTVPSFFDSL